MSTITCLFVEKSEEDIKEELIRRVYLGEITRSDIKDGLSKLRRGADSSIPIVIKSTKKLIKITKERYELEEKINLDPYIESKIENTWNHYEDSIKELQGYKKQMEQGLKKGERVYKEVDSLFLSSFEDYCEKRKEFELAVQDRFASLVNSINQLTRQKDEKSVHNFKESEILNEAEKLKQKGLDILITKYEDKIRRRDPELLDKLKKAGKSQQTIPSYVKTYDKEKIEDRIDSILKNVMNYSKDTAFEIYIPPIYLKKFTEELKKEHEAKIRELDNKIKEEEIYFEENDVSLESWLMRSKAKGKEEMIKLAETALEKLKKDTDDKKYMIQKDIGEKTTKYNLMNECIKELLPKFKNIYFHNRLTNTLKQMMKKLEQINSEFKITLKETRDKTREQLSSNAFSNSLDSYIEKIGESKIAYVI